MLQQRHADAVFVAECKDGPTHTRNHLRLDAWVLAKTWSPVTTIGYEIKVDRADWRRDDKLHNYMALCHLLYVAAPKGVVPVDELPAGVGLIEPVGQSGRLQVKRKAARREIQLPAELMVYVLMCRSKITRETGEPTERGWRNEELRKWVAEKDERLALSYAVSNRIREKFDALRDEMRAVRQQNEHLEPVKKRIVELGFEPGQPISSWTVNRKLDELCRTIDEPLLNDIRRTAKRMTEAADQLEALKRSAPESEVA
jgi:hypothetical protein